MVTLRNIVIEYIAPETLVINRELKKHDATIVEGGFDEFGLIDPVVVTNDGVVVSGHGRIAAALSAKVKDKKGYDEIPIIRLPFDEVEALAYMIANDRSTEDGRWSTNKLRKALTKLSDKSYDLSKTGFSPEDIALIEQGSYVEREPLKDDRPERPTFICQYCGTELKYNKKSQIVEVEKDVSDN